MVEVSELLRTLEKMRVVLTDNLTQLADRIPAGIKGADEETFLLSICGELNDCSRKLIGVIESLRDYNNRHDVPIS